MDENFSAGKIAYEHVRKLVEEIGPRPAGSFKEQQAFDYICLQLNRMGYHPVKIPVDFAPIPRLYPFNIIGGILLALAGIFAKINPLITLFIPLVFALLPDIAREETRRRRKTQKTANVVATTETENEKPLLIVCAHVDSALTLPSRWRVLQYFYWHSFDIIQRVAFLVTAASSISLLGFVVPIAFWKGVGLFSCLAGAAFAGVDIWRQFGNQTSYSPGAVDNASGVGAVLALAEYYAVNPPKWLSLGFLFCGAEETGLYGAEDYAQNLRKRDGKTAVINLDMVGAGNILNYVSKDGVIRSLYTNEILNQVLIEADPAVRPVWYSIRSGDFAAFLRNKIPAISLETRGSAVSKNTYHTIKDGMDLVEPETLERVAQTVIKFIELLPYSRWMISKGKKG